MNLFKFLFGESFKDKDLQLLSRLMNAQSISVHRLAFWVVGSIFLALILFIVCFLFLSKPKRMEIEKLSAYECGFSPFEDAYGRFDIKFYLVAILFIIFDLEVIYLFPWALIVHTSINALFILFVMYFFLFILIIGFIYEWKRGALDW